MVIRRRRRRGSAQVCRLLMMNMLKTQLTAAIFFHVEELAGRLLCSLLDQKMLGWSPNGVICIRLHPEPWLVTSNLSYFRSTKWLQHIWTSFSEPAGSSKDMHETWGMRCFIRVVHVNGGPRPVWGPHKPPHVLISPRQSLFPLNKWTYLFFHSLKTKENQWLLSPVFTSYCEHAKKENCSNKI